MLKKQKARYYKNKSKYCNAFGPRRKMRSRILKIGAQFNIYINQESFYNKKQVQLA